MEAENLRSFLMSAVGYARAQGHRKVSIVYWNQGGLFLFPCMRCGVIVDSVEGFHTFLPKKKEERAFVYFLCDRCRQKAFKDPKIFEEIEDQLILSRAVARKIKV